MPPKQKPNGKQRAPAQQKYCERCETWWPARGFHSHERSCKKKLCRPDGDDVFQELVDQREAQYNALQGHPPLPRSSGAEIHAVDFEMGVEFEGDNADGHTGTRVPIHVRQKKIPGLLPLRGWIRMMSPPSPPSIPDVALPPKEQFIPDLDDIKIKHHPASGKPDEYYHFDDYNPKSDIRLKQASIPVDHKPWKPFRTRLDFEIAEIILDTHMNSKQTKTLLSLIRCCIETPEGFTIRNVKDLSDTWTFAHTTKTSGFEYRDITVPYKGEQLVYDMYTRPLFNWCFDLLQDKSLVPLFHWNAEKHFKFDGDRFERFYNELWTGKAWWDIQSCLPTDSVPFCIILYADKTRLSSFGTAKGYPVVARCANLPAEVRNGDGVGGGRLVGWLPIVEEDAGESGKRGFINLKRVVWHHAFLEILESIVKYTFTGYELRCGDDVTRQIFFFILILSADYEEQCVMALIRGTRSRHPCPICLVPEAQLSNLSEVYPLRSTDEMKNVVETARQLRAAEREEVLKDHGLRNVENVFWKMDGSDVYKALSWDRLHAYHGGLFSDHLWVEFKEIIEGLGRKSAKSVDEQYVSNQSSQFPEAFMREFADGGKYEDISKIVVFASHNILSPEITPRGYTLLKLMRSYLELDMFMSLKLHTETTIAHGRKELLVFNDLLQKYKPFNALKNWNFPKGHTHQHAFDDIENKGVTRNYNTKLGEKKNVPLKVQYKFHTNFKDVAPQILKVNEADLIANMIRDALDHLNDFTETQRNLNEPSGNDKKSSNELLHISLGSALQPSSLGEIEAKHVDTSGFEQLHIKIAQRLTRILEKNVRIAKEKTIQVYQMMRVRYETKTDWEQRVDILRVNPSFHHREQHDFVLVQVDKGRYIFAQLLLIFGIVVDEAPGNEELLLDQIRSLQAELADLKGKYSAATSELSDFKLAATATKGRHQKGAAIDLATYFTRLGCFHHAFFSAIFNPTQALGHPQPDFAYFDPRRYESSEAIEFGPAAEVYACIPEEYHSLILSSDVFARQYGGGISSGRSSAIHSVCTEGQALFGISSVFFHIPKSAKDSTTTAEEGEETDASASDTGTPGHQDVRFQPDEVDSFIDFDMVPPCRHVRKYTNEMAKMFPPILYEGFDRTKPEALFLNPILFMIIHVVLYGKGAAMAPNANSCNFWSNSPYLRTDGHAPGVTYSLISWAAVLAIYVLSDDTVLDGAGIGNITQTDYGNYALLYKQYLIQYPNRTWINSLFGKWNNAVYPPHIHENVKVYTADAPSMLPRSSTQPAPMESGRTNSQTVQELFAALANPAASNPLPDQDDTSDSEPDQPEAQSCQHLSSLSSDSSDNDSGALATRLTRSLTLSTATSSTSTQLSSRPVLSKSATTRTRISQQPIVPATTHPHILPQPVVPATSSYVIPDPSFLLPTDNPEPRTIASHEHISATDVTEMRPADKSKKVGNRATRIATAASSSSTSGLEDADADTTIIAPPSLPATRKSARSKQPEVPATSLDSAATSASKKRSTRSGKKRS
ncbi:hypothetical protein NLJ89_g9890 [Agrocybe chaxingu]|uniref:Uncharacterized protein n=1 Tax=Agrocybe chaxingu TaxID=84603 RepID=A0A9W8JPV2_9AGAR|nr:hypothetical protein NLJ89_g9890 [Agrocybe chaxingu]